MKDTKLNITLNVVARWFVGLVFLFSSFVKGVDPMGTAFKITEYMTAWSIGGLSFEWAVPMAPVLSVMLIIAEFLVGVLLIAGAFRRLTAWMLVLMMLFFTVSTLIDAITNKVTDCGCFGDAVKLTNWQTFWKNVVLDVPALWILLTRNLRRKNRFERDMIVAVVSVVAMTLFSLYNIMNEPCIDFRAWKVGKQMIPYGEELEVKSYLTYQNKQTGETVEFESKDLMEYYKDTAWVAAWEWKDSRVVDPYEIQADGFSMLGIDGEDYAKELIASDEPLMIATIHHLDKVSSKGIAAIHEAARWAAENNCKFVLLSAALTEEMDAFIYDNSLTDVSYFFADATAIETMLRSNPGFLLLKGATVLGKWHYRNVADLEDFNLEQ